MQTVAGRAESNVGLTRFVMGMLGSSRSGVRQIPPRLKVMEVHVIPVFRKVLLAHGFLLRRHLDIKTRLTAFSNTTDQIRRNVRRELVLSVTVCHGQKIAQVCQQGIDPVFTLAA